MLLSQDLGDLGGNTGNKAFNVFICGRQNLEVAACPSLVGLCRKTRDKMVAARGVAKSEWPCNMLLLKAHVLKRIFPGFNSEDLKLFIQLREIN